MVHATDKAGDWFGPLSIVGQARMGGTVVTREARGAAVLWNVADYNTEFINTRITRDLLFASSAEQSPFLVEPAELKTWETSVAAKLQIPLKFSRHGDFKQKVKLRAIRTGATEPLKDWEEDGKAASTVLELDLAKVKVPPGEHEIFVLAQTTGKYRNLRPDELKVAEALAKTTDEKRKLAESEAASAREVEKKASETLGAASQALEESEKLLKQAGENNAEANKQFQAAAAAKAVAQKNADEAAAKAKAADERKEVAAKLAKDAGAKLQQRDVTATFYSPALHLHVAAAPITLAALVGTNSFAPGTKFEIPVTVGRLYGFADAVELGLKEIPGLKANRITIAKDQTTGKLAIEASDEAKPGEQALTLQASVKFNGQDLKFEHLVTVRLAEASPR
jgi:hypothetical protein